jgi:hypothetical protein
MPVGKGPALGTGFHLHGTNIIATAGHNIANSPFAKKSNGTLKHYEIKFPNQESFVVDDLDETYAATDLDLGAIKIPNEKVDASKGLDFEGKFPDQGEAKWIGN